MNKIIQAALAEVEAATDGPYWYELDLPHGAGRVYGSGPNSYICTTSGNAHKDAKHIRTALNSHKAALELAAASEDYFQSGCAKEYRMPMRDAMAAYIETLDRENG